MSEERLQKILARAGIASRRKAEEIIREGRVTINGEVAEIGAKADPERDAVKLDERRIHTPATHRYLLLNKPRGVMSTVSDPGGRKTVIDLVPPALRRALVPVGRLDFLTEGLLLLTDDGELAQQVSHPRNGCWKTYEVKVRGRPAEELIERLRAGIVLEGRRTAPCRISPRDMRRLARRTGGSGRGKRAGDGDNSWWLVELGEGRTRQIREMFQRVGHPVQKLRRVAIGPVSDPDLPLGAVRELTEREVARLRKATPPRETGKGRAGAAGAPAPPKGGAIKGAIKKDPRGSAAGADAPREIAPIKIAPRGGAKKAAAPRKAQGTTPRPPGSRAARSGPAGGGIGGEKRGRAGTRTGGARPGGAKRGVRGGPRASRAAPRSGPGSRPGGGRPGGAGARPRGGVPSVRPGGKARNGGSGPRAGGRSPGSGSGPRVGGGDGRRSGLRGGGRGPAPRRGGR
jgi:23S rRNA pseudouridine2605 synthase